MASDSSDGLKVSKAYFEAGDILFKEGDPPAGLFIIEEGTVEIVRFAGARMVTTARLGRGDTVGELAMLENIPHTRSARAVGPVVALRIAPQQLYDALDQSPALIRMLLKRVVRKLHRTNDVAFGSTRRKD